MSASDENLSEATTLKVLTYIFSLFSSAFFFIYYKSISFALCQEKTGALAGYFKKSPNLAPRSVVTEVIKLMNLMLHVLMCVVRLSCLSKILHIDAIFACFPGSSQSDDGGKLQL